MLKYKLGDNLKVVLEVESVLKNPTITFTIYDLMGDSVLTGTGTYDSDKNYILCSVDFSELSEGLYEIQVKATAESETKVFYQLIEVEK